MLILISFLLVEFKVNLSTNVFNFTGGPFGEETYQFLQLHFHWGSDSKKGSEHTIKGKRWGKVDLIPLIYLIRKIIHLKMK